MANQFRDSVFRSYFNDKVRLLSLCNALIGTNFDNPDELTINTLEGTFFNNQRNDISCSIHNQFLVLLEHQSSVNHNMPFRCLSYVAELLNKLISDKRALYRKKLITFPAPKFFVLYNGNEPEPLSKTMKLSDAFDGDDSSLELIVTAYNINKDVHQPLLNQCHYLNDYSTLVYKVKQGIKAGLSRHDAIIVAVKFCIDNGIMKGYLEYNSEEVFNMLALEWDSNIALQARYDDGYEAGENSGLEKGRFAEKEAIALKMLLKGTPISDIQDMTDLPLARIHELAKKNLSV